MARLSSVAGFLLGMLAALLLNSVPAHFLGDYQCPACHCKCILGQVAPAVQDAIAIGSTGKISNKTATFCPWDVQFSNFVSPQRVIDLGAGQSICIDAVIYAYDLLFERDHLWRKTKWVGVANQQDPTDAMVFQDMLWQLKPDVVIELGTNEGGGALFYATIMSLYSNTSRVIAIDPTDIRHPLTFNLRCSDKSPCETADQNPIWKQHVTFIQGVPSNAEITARVEQEIKKLGAQKVMVVEDSVHQYGIVLDNMKAYAKFVTPGMYMIVQDGKMTRFAKNQNCGSKPTQAEQEAYYKAHGKVGPSDAIEDFLSGSTDFVADRSWEFLFYTQHPKGFLLRK